MVAKCRCFAIVVSRELKASVVDFVCISQIVRRFNMIACETVEKPVFDRSFRPNSYESFLGEDIEVAGVVGLKRNANF